MLRFTRKFLCSRQTLRVSNITLCDAGCSVKASRSHACNTRSFSFASRRSLASMPPLTSERYSVTRGNFAELTDDDIRFFKETIPGAGVLTAEDDLAGYNMDWLGTVRGHSSVVLRPTSTEEISAVLAHCHKRGIAVCPQGGNTGLVGGSVPVFDEVIISTQRMNNIVSIDDVSGVIVCQSGCILQELDHALGEHGLRMPLDLAPKGSCHIGGNVSTNAGGLRVLRYGSLHGSVLGAEFVLADGTVVDVLSELRKNNTGYDLKQLMIGSEGTLGVVTKLSIGAVPIPNTEHVALLACNDYEDVLAIFKAAKKHLGEIMSAYEFFDQESLQVVTQNLGIKNQLSCETPFYVVVETGGSDETHDEEKVHRLLEKLMEDGIVLDGAVASEPSKRPPLWDVRERISEALKMDGYVYKYDISLPLRDLYTVVEEVRERLKDNSAVKRVSGFGHIGDGNLHLNITSERYEEDVQKMLEPWLWEWTQRVRGSISAEHGIGFKKRNYLGYSQSPAAIDLMAQLKHSMDPKGILNPYKILPDAP